MFASAGPLAALFFEELTSPSLPVESQLTLVRRANNESTQNCPGDIGRRLVPPSWMIMSILSVNVVREALSGLQKVFNLKIELLGGPSGRQATESQIGDAHQGVGDGLSEVGCNSLKRHASRGIFEPIYFHANHGQWQVINGELYWSTLPACRASE
ncbi:hypothetical protein OG21DRAFT_1523419 [Imleria badia]|nr:hypothetical protein OG21DRAFT_1523419 [Imleria badia]